MQSLQRLQRPSIRRRRNGTSVSRRAFTMIELVIVLLIMSILTAVAAPTFFGSLLLHRVESAARRVKADLELARTQARLTSASQSATFTNSAGTYALSLGIKSLDKPGAIYTVDLKKEPYKLTSATANFSGAPSVSFDGYGTPNSGGTVVLTAKSYQCTVTLNGVTGDVTITSNHGGALSAAMPGG